MLPYYDAISRLCYTAQTARDQFMSHFHKAAVHNSTSPSLRRYLQYVIMKYAYFRCLRLSHNLYVQTYIKTFRAQTAWNLNCPRSTVIYASLSLECECSYYAMNKVTATTSN